jgi:hypothetical protein
MPNKTIYVKDEHLWDQARQLAGKDGLSGVIQEALCKFVENKRRQSEGFQRYRFDTTFTHYELDWGPSDAIAFEGREVASKILPVTVQQGDNRGEKFDRYFRAYPTRVGTLLVTLNPREKFDRHFTVYQTRAGKLLLTVTPEYSDRIEHYAVYEGVRALANDPELAAAHAVARAALLNEVSEELGEDWAIWID